MAKPVDAAVRWLKDRLAVGPVPIERAIAEAQRAGLSETALRAAKRRAGIKAIDHAGTRYLVLPGTSDVVTGIRGADYTAGAG